MNKNNILSWLMAIYIVCLPSMLWRDLQIWWLRRQTAWHKFRKMRFQILIELNNKDMAIMRKKRLDAGLDIY